MCSSYIKNCVVTWMTTWLGAENCVEIQIESAWIDAMLCASLLVDAACD